MSAVGWIGAARGPIAWCGIRSARNPRVRHSRLKIAAVQIDPATHFAGGKSLL
jgi:hypothetical protein